MTNKSAYFVSASPPQVHSPCGGMPDGGASSSAQESEPVDGWQWDRVKNERFPSNEFLQATYLVYTL